MSNEPIIEDADLRQLARALSSVLGELHRLVDDTPIETLADRLGVHLGADPRGMPLLSHEFPSYQLVDVQVALEAWSAHGPGRTIDIVGVAGDQRRFHPLSELLLGHHGTGIGPVEYVDVADSPTSTRSCVKFGVFLLDENGHRSVALLRGADPHGPMQNAMLEIVDADKEAGERLMAELKRLAVDRSVLRGQVLSFGPGDGHQYGQMRFMSRPVMDRDELVLPDLTLAQIERHVVAIAGHRERLKQAGQHLKRGVLLYGPPGTGKTHTVRYLLSKCRNSTAFVMSGQALGLIAQACALARVLQPSIIILEDIDLIAADRSFAAIGSNPLLFEVLNQMDGLGDDVDVTFLLTTNRVDILERALAERPGRVDAAVEIAPPDRDGRLRLLRLYGASLGVDNLSDEQLEPTIQATDGRTATYLREVVRRSALLAAERQTSGALILSADLLEDAANELLIDRASLTRAVLDGSEEPDAEPPMGGSPRFGYKAAPGMTFARQVGNRFIRSAPLSSGDPTPFAPDE